MATLEDKILGDKLHNYCSSSEESDDERDDERDSSKEEISKLKEEDVILPEVAKWEGTSQNTGPKGVMKDWKQFKQLEKEKRVEQELERIALAKKLTLTVQSALDEEKETLEDPDIAELLDDDFLLEYQKQQMQKMLERCESRPHFGNLIYLGNGEEYLDAIDKENKLITVIVHIYENNIEACRVMNECLDKLAEIYKNTKFCAIRALHAGVSINFKLCGLPALLIYKNGLLLSNFVRLTDDLGSNFYMEDLQEFLVEHGLLEDKTCYPTIIRDGETFINA